MHYNGTIKTNNHSKNPPHNNQSKVQEDTPMY